MALLEQPHPARPLPLRKAPWWARPHHHPTLFPARLFGLRPHVAPPWSRSGQPLRTFAW